MDTANNGYRPEVGARKNIAVLSDYRHMGNKGMNAAFVDGHAKMMSYYDIPDNGSAGLGNSTKDPNSFWAQWKN